MLNKDSLIYGMAVSLRGNWKSLVVTDLLYKLLAFMAITPLFAILFRGLLTIGGHEVLSDLDIAIFLAGPYGWFCFVLLGAAWLAILALEQASLIAILAATQNGKRLGAFASLGFALRSAPSTLRVGGRLALVSLIIFAPFMLVAALIYFSTLGEYDINYYLDAQPVVFKFAVGLGSVVGTILIIVFLRLISSWFIALPLVLFDRVTPTNSLRQSRKIVSGSRCRVLLWLAVWLFISLTINIIGAFLVARVGGYLIPTSTGPLTVLAGRVGLMLILLALVSTLVNLIATISFTLVLFHAYQKLNPNSLVAMAQTEFSNSRDLNYLQNLTRQRVAAIGLIGTLAAALIGITAIRSLKLVDRVEVMAHRGASKIAPENSLAAFQYAIEAKSDWIEIDVQETADGEVVVVHDSDLMRLARNKIKIWEATMSDLRSIDIGSHCDPLFSQERVPTLGEVLTLCRGKVGVIVELKYYGHDKQLEQRVVDIIEQNAMENHIMVMSLKPEGVKKLKALRPHWKCGVLMSVAIGNIQKIEADFLAVNAKFATRSLVSRLHKVNKQVFVWTLDDAATISMLMNRGVDGILTNRPEIAREVLLNRSEISSSERLLVEIAVLLGKEPLFSDQ